MRVLGLLFVAAWMFATYKAIEDPQGVVDSTVENAKKLGFVENEISVSGKSFSFTAEDLTQFWGWGAAGALGNIILFELLTLLTASGEERLSAIRTTGLGLLAFAAVGYFCAVTGRFMAVAAFDVVVVGVYGTLMLIGFRFAVALHSLFASFFVLSIYLQPEQCHTYAEGTYKSLVESGWFPEGTPYTMAALVERDPGLFWYHLGQALAVAQLVIMFVLLLSENNSGIRNYRRATVLWTFVIFPIGVFYTHVVPVTYAVMCAPWLLASFIVLQPSNDTDGEKTKKKKQE